jgi:hypothetical protein
MFNHFFTAAVHEKEHSIINGGREEFDERD